MNWRSQLNLQDESWTFFRTAISYKVSLETECGLTGHRALQEVAFWNSKAR